jgi:hypothetical protein
MNMIGEIEPSLVVKETNIDIKIDTEPSCTTHPLKDNWVLYHHLPSEKDWTLKGYTVLSDQINTVEKVISLNRSLTDNIIKYSMLFFMRKGITPLWEDPANCTGGCFSYKVVNKHVVQVWRHMMFHAAGETLATENTYNDCINGITISPKKNFCIIKIWLRNSDNQDPNKITVIDNLTKHGVMFKLHGDS